LHTERALTPSSRIKLSNTLSAYTINSSTGYLTAVSGSPFASTGNGPVSLVVDPNGAFLYAANNGSNTVSVYSIDTTSGALASAGLPIATGSGPLALTIDPSDSFLYVANLASNSVSAYSISNGNADSHQRFALCHRYGAEFNDHHAEW
jgi:6-phosphogluconolactonase